MHLSNLPAGSRVFVDANVMVYFFLQVEPFAEICEDFFPRDAVNYLKSHPDAVKQLQWYRTIPSDIAEARVHILDITYRELHASKKYRADYGLLTGDSIILAVMERYKLIHLVTNDPDFERVPGIRVWMPR